MALESKITTSQGVDVIIKPDALGTLMKFTRKINVVNEGVKTEEFQVWLREEEVQEMVAALELTNRF